MDLPPPPLQLTPGEEQIIKECLKLLRK